MPVSPRNVHFVDDDGGRRSESVLPEPSQPLGRPLQPLHSSPHAFRPVHPAAQPKVRPEPSPSTWPQEAKSSASALDEATLDLLRLTSDPPPVTFSGSRRFDSHADRLPKAASTSSMNKVIRTNVSGRGQKMAQDGGLLKVANVFTWDAGSGSQGRSSDDESAAMRLPSRRREVIHEAQVLLPFACKPQVERQGPPVVRTTVEGKLKMEKIVGADLITVDECVSSAWTVRDTLTNYKVPLSPPTDRRCRSRRVWGRRVSCWRRRAAGSPSTRSR